VTSFQPIRADRLLDGHFRLSAQLPKRETPMRCTARTQQEFILTPDQFKRLIDLGYKAIPATLSQTMGPNWRHIFFVSRDGSKKHRGRVHYYDVPMTPAALYALARSA
jgi:hypothetical protein